MEIKSDSPIYVAILDLFEKALREDDFIRRDRMRSWVRCHQFWEGLQYTFWDELSSNWRQPPDEMLDNLPKVINYFKGHGESIIAALSSTTPGVRFFPDDADDPGAVETAHAFSRLDEALQKNCNPKLLSVKALFTLYNEDYVAAYISSEDDEDYGEIYTPQFKPTDVATCPNCGEQVPSMEELCPNCGTPPVQETQYILDSYRKSAKSKTVVDVLGAIFVKIPYYARYQKDVTYIIKAQEYHYAKLRRKYPNFRDHITPGVDLSRYDAWGRMEYRSYMESNLTTLYEFFVRPDQYEIVEDEATRKQLYSQFPKGIKACLVGGTGSYIIVDVQDRALDDCWEICFVGTSNYLHGRPIGEAYLPIQEMQNELANLTIQTIEYGIPETFVDSNVLDLEKYGQRESMPGTMTAAQAPPGKSLGDGFTQLRAATLGDDVEPFSEKLEEMGQFVLGDFPSVFGGSSGGSKTYGEYALSRTQALQRLGLYWSAYTWFWAQTRLKACLMHVQAMQEGGFDENLVTAENGGYKNNWIRRAQLTGKIGRVEPESSETLPISAAQKMDILFKLIELNNPDINSVIYSADNAEFISQALGYPELKIPGALQRQKQFEEIQQLLVSEPMTLDPTGQLGFQSSVPIEPDLDDDQGHIDVLRSFLLQYGKDLQATNPPGYINCMAHLKAHTENQKAQQLMLQGAMTNENENTSQPVAG